MSRSPVEALEDSGERQHRRLVVGEQRARLGVGGNGEEAPDGIGRIDRRGFRQRLAIVTGRHRRDVADPHPSGPVIGVLEQLGQVIADEVVERQPTVTQLQRERRSRERLAERVDEAGAAAGVWRPVALRDPMAVSLDDQAVRLDPRVALEGVEERHDPVGVDPLGGRAVHGDGVVSIVAL